jgi:hypothetical protein
MNDPAAWGPAGLMAIVFGLIETIKYVSRRRANGVNGNQQQILNGIVGALIRLEHGCEEGNRRLDLILIEFKAEREAIRANERNRIAQERMEKHFEKMEGVQRKEE